MAWSTGRILLQLYSHRVQRQSFAATTPEGSGGQKLGPSGTLESETGTKLNMEGFPTTSKGSYMECLFSKWLQDHSSIHGTWHRYFKDLVEDNAPASSNDTSSAKSDSGVKSGSEASEPENIITPQSEMGLVSQANELVSKLPEKMTQQQTPEEPKKEAKEDQKASPRRRRRKSKFSLLHKFVSFRKQALATKRSNIGLHRGLPIPESKSGRRGRSKANNTMHFKSYFEDKQNKEKDKQLKRKQDGRKDIPKENELPGKPQEKLQTIHLGEGAYDPNKTPKTLKYQSPEAHDQDIAPINMALPERIHQGDEALKLCKMPEDIKSFTDLPSALIDHSEKCSKSEDKVLSSEDQAIEPISSAEETEEPKSENLQSPLGNVTNSKPQTDAPSQPSP